VFGEGAGMLECAEDVGSGGRAEADEVDVRNAGVVVGEGSPGCESE
jgi:hypothetical protein